MWKEIDEKYEASTDGHIRNAKTKHILREFKGKDGYLRTQFGGKSRTVHRVIAKTFLPEDEERTYVNHIDGDKTNNAVENLEWCTFSENMRHAYDNELMKPKTGINNGRNILSEEDVKYIREHCKKRDPVYSRKALAEKFNVAHQTISAVLSGQNWKQENEDDQE